MNASCLEKNELIVLDETGDTNEHAFLQKANIWGLLNNRQMIQRSS